MNFWNVCETFEIYFEKLSYSIVPYDSLTSNGEDSPFSTKFQIAILPFSTKYCRYRFNSYYFTAKNTRITSRMVYCTLFSTQHIVWQHIECDLTARFRSE